MEGRPVPARLLVHAHLGRGRIYFFTKEGRGTVLDGKGSETVVAENTLSLDGRLYGVAVVDGRILVLTGTELICIAELSP